MKRFLKLLASLAAVGHGLLIHEHMAHGYGVTLTQEDRSSVHIRPVEQMLAQVLRRDSRPLDVARPPAHVAFGCVQIPETLLNLSGVGVEPVTE